METIEKTQPNGRSTATSQTQTATLSTYSLQVSEGPSLPGLYSSYSWGICSDMELTVDHFSSNVDYFLAPGLNSFPEFRLITEDAPVGGGFVLMSGQGELAIDLTEGAFEACYLIVLVPEGHVVPTFDWDTAIGLWESSSHPPVADMFAPPPPPKIIVKNVDEKISG